jgi:hypothetical protein
MHLLKFWKNILYGCALPKEKPKVSSSSEFYLEPEYVNV